MEREGLDMSIERGRHRDEWFITFWLPPELSDGKRARAPKRLVHGKKSEAKDALARYKIEYLAELEREREKQESTESPTVASYVQRYHEEKKMKSPLAYKREGLEVRHIQRLFAGVRLTELSPKVIRETYAKERRRREDGLPLPDGGAPLSENGLYKVHVKLRQIMRQAFEDGEVGRNPCDAVRFPKPPQSQERHPLTIDEARRFRRCVLSELRTSPDPRLVALLIASSTGARRGELLGLSWGDVDFRSGTVYIHCQYSTDKRLRDAKSDSRRTLPMDPDLIETLSWWRDEQARKLAEINDRRHGLNLAPVTQEDSYPLVNGNLGDRLDPNNFDRFFRNWSVDHGFGRFTRDVVTKTYGGRTFTRGKGYEGLKIHELRHTVASLLIADGLDVKSAQRQLGHASAQTTLNIYAHAFESRSHEAADRLAALYGEDGGRGASA